ncbi:hypothetical protein AMTRI_Chr03g55350 [Amborella trichopoda]
MCLIEGLPDDLALQCLARVPFSLYPSLSLVSPSWRDAIRSPDLVKARISANSTQDLLCVSASEPGNNWQLYDPARNIWMTLPPPPPAIVQLESFGTACVDGRLFVLGGIHRAMALGTWHSVTNLVTDEVWSYDPAARRWDQCASMLSPRCMFACCGWEGKILVAGGYTTEREMITNVEVYYPEHDAWVPMPSIEPVLCQGHKGLVLGGKVHVLHMELPTAQVWEGEERGWEIVDHHWSPLHSVVVGDELYTVSCRQVEAWGERGRGPPRRVGPGHRMFHQRFGGGLASLGGKVYVFGGTLQYKRRQLYDMHCLDEVEAGKPKWCCRAGMTRGKGNVLGFAVLRI